MMFRGSKVQTRRDHDFFHATISSIQKVALSFFLHRLVQWFLLFSFSFLAKKQQTKARYDAICM